MMRKAAVFMSCLLAASSCALPGCADDLPAPAAAQSPAPSRSPLQGGVEHREKMAPVAADLMPGARFDDTQLRNETPGNVWYQVPPWLAGTWQFKTETVTSLESYTSQRYPRVPFVLKNEFQRTYGLQVDKSGQVWDYVNAPSSYTTKLDSNLIGIEHTVRIDIVKDEPDEIIRVVYGPDSVVEPETNLILQTHQKECFNRLTQYGEDALFINSSMKMFDMQGNPMVQKESNMLGFRVKPFAVTDEKDGRNMKSLFAEYLREHGKAQLIP